MSNAPTASYSVTVRLQIDNKPGYQSKLAHDFDLIVYFTLTHQLGPNSSMVDAANAVKDTAVKAGAKAVIRTDGTVSNSTPETDSMSEPPGVSTTEEPDPTGNPET